MGGIIDLNIKLRNERKNRIKKEIERIKKILPKLNIEKAILFGSSARGDIGINSDIDLIIIMNTDLKFLDRLDLFYRKLRPNLAIDILVYTPKEFEEIKRSLFGKNVIKDGIILYERK
jgi:predicted nucleotidyltransferase